MIESFGHFLIGGNFAVGLIVFAILVVINFIVVTKGAERIAEVGARFTLDAMPGKQMAIDADLNAGLIDEEEARRRRAEVGEEAEFFGSMDGASKFVRGDAIAGMLILFINIIGGFVIGVVQHGLSAAQAAEQLHPAGRRRRAGGADPGAADLGGRGDGGLARRQGRGHRQRRSAAGVRLAAALAITAGIVGALGLIPGMPHVVFLLIAAGIGWLAWWMRRRQQAATAAAAQPRSPKSCRANAEASWDDLQPVDTLGLEVGYRLIALVDKARARRPARRASRACARSSRRTSASCRRPVHIRDNLELKPSAYRVTLRGAVIGEGEAFPGMLLAINPGGATQQLPGTTTTDPAFGLPAVWIEERQREMAQMAGFTVVDCATVVATHLSHLMQVNAARLLGRVETQQLVEHVTKLAPKLIEDVVPKMVGIATLQKVLQLLLEEGVHIRDMRSIVECLAEHASHRHRPGRAGAPHPRAPGAGDRAADLRPGARARRDRARTRTRAPGRAGADLAARRRARPRRGRHADPPAPPRPHAAGRPRPCRPACWCPT